MKKVLLLVSLSVGIFSGCTLPGNPPSDSITEALSAGFMVGVNYAKNHSSTRINDLGIFDMDVAFQDDLGRECDGITLRSSWYLTREQEISVVAVKKVGCRIGFSSYWAGRLLAEGGYDDFSLCDTTFADKLRQGVPGVWEHYGLPATSYRELTAQEMTRVKNTCHLGYTENQ